MTPTATTEATLTLQHSTKTSLHGTGDGFYNPKMAIGRDLAVLCAVEQNLRLTQSSSTSSSTTLGDRRAARSLDGTMRLLDGFSGVGALALRWASSLPSSVEITANDRSTICQEYIRVNCAKNNSHNNYNHNNVLVVGKDVNCLLSEAAVEAERRPYDMIHLDPFGCVTSHLDAAMRCLSGGGILSFTATDVSALCDRRYRNVAKRHYGVSFMEKRDPDTFRETALRAVLSAVARSAARQDKGIKVLMACSVEHFFLVQIEVVRGTKEADRTAATAQWMRTGRQKNLVVEGPLWSGSLGDSNWLDRLAAHAKTGQIPLAASKNKLFKLLTTLSKETFDGLSLARSPGQETHFSSIIRLSSVYSELKLNETPKRDAVVSELVSLGAKASATHLDPRSIRTTSSRATVIQAVQNIVKRSGGRACDVVRSKVSEPVQGKRRSVLVVAILGIVLSVSLFCAIGTSRRQDATDL